ncbi:hypothetical protein SDC9_207264 [bioreactor metagenome]|uniref:Uncharacterized protein n=1 Tax=bioreactor metagenome TaxID=1076179 RepID=A0A645JIT9_9ZZZZ
MQAVKRLLLHRDHGAVVALAPRRGGDRDIDPRLRAETVGGRGHEVGGVDGAVRIHVGRLRDRAAMLISNGYDEALSRFVADATFD